MSIEVCEMRPDDFNNVVALWGSNCQAYFPGGSNERELAIFLAKTRGLNLVARHGESIIGIVICFSRDISGASCQAVIDSTSEAGDIANILIGKAMQKLTTAVGKCNIHIVNDDFGHSFWHASQWNFDSAVESVTIAAFESVPVAESMTCDESVSSTVIPEQSGSSISAGSASDIEAA